MTLLGMDRSFEPRADSRFAIAMDKDSVREKTREGRLIVKRTHITKANVCPYRGEEIPGWQELGLDPKRVYNLLRDPDELEKAAPTLNGVQLLIKHKPVSAQDHAPYETVGSLGSDAEFDGEYLDNSLYVNAQNAIDLIETGRQRELSAGYHYEPDMTPGNFRGSAYDGVMRNITFNHVALVEDGRAGPDVVVGDEALKENGIMKVTRLGARTLHLTASAIAPLLAMDQKITLPADLVGTFKGLTTKNFKDERGKIVGGVRLALDGKKLRKGLALDSSIEKFGKALDAFIDDVNAGMDEPAPEEANAAIEQAAKIEPPPAEAPPDEPEVKTYDAVPLRNFLRQKGLGEDDIAKCMDMMPKPGVTGDSDKDEDKDDEDKKDMIDKPAMDAALKAQAETLTSNFNKRLDQVRKDEQAIRAAIHDVQPWVGELPATMAFDTAAAVYRKACEMKGVENAATLHADALLPILKTTPKIGAKSAPSNAVPVLAMDAVEKAKKLAPGLEHISTSL